MTIMRRIHTSNFTIIGNACLCDESLSAEALGVICYLIGRPHDWTLRQGQLSGRFKCGADRIQRILRELIAAGYIRKIRHRDPATQKWQAVEFIVLDTKDEPLPENTYVAPATMDEPQVENPSMDFPALLRTEDNKTDSKKEPRKSKRAKAGDYTEDFLQTVWQPYPRKTNTSKMNAFKKYTALGEADQAAVRTAVPAFAVSKRGTEEQFIPHLEFFISRRIFETVGVLSESAAALSEPAPIDRQTWENLGRIYNSTNNWHREWGPEPGHPKCRMPPDLQQRFIPGNVNTGLTAH